VIVEFGRIEGVDKPISRLALGSVSFTTAALPAAFELLDHFVARGGNAVDTSYHYGQGDTDRAIGAWLVARGTRERMVIVGKGAHTYPHRPHVTPEAITDDLLRSLDGLQTDYIDLYLLHRDDPSQPVDAIVDCLNEHQTAGRIRAFGGSNWSTSRIDAANTYAHAHSLTPFVAASPNFSLAVWNEPPWAGCIAASTGEERAWYAARQFPLLSWSSQAQGFFTGRYEPDDRSRPDMARCWYNTDNFERLARARELAERKSSTATAVALAYVLRQPFPTFALIGPLSTGELDSSAAALDVSLTPDELRWLNLEAD